MNKEYDFDVNVLKEDGLDKEDFDMIQEEINQSVKEATDEINQMVEDNKEQLDKEFEEIMKIEDPAERHKKLLEYNPWMEE